MDQEQLEIVRTGRGFFAALDQSGGSTPKALLEYGLSESDWSSDVEMFDLVHAMRARIIASPVFTSERVLATILFEGTMDREVDGVGSAEYLWTRKRIVPLVKVDQGLADVKDGVQPMKPLDRLAGLLARARDKGVFGTKMRSLVKEAVPAGIDRVLDQQFEVARQILGAGLLPVLEPEVDIGSATRAEADELLVAGITRRLDALPPGSLVALKLSLPARSGHYDGLMAHPGVVRVVALSGGYRRSEACLHLRENPGLIASFSRALLEGLTAQRTPEEFDRALGEAIQEIWSASTARPRRRSASQ